MRQLSRLPWQQLYRQTCATRALRYVGYIPRHHDAQPTSTKKKTPYKPLTNGEVWEDEDDNQRRRREIEERKASQPSYLMRFTCAKCLTRSSHRISKQGYFHGTILVNCPGCNNKHLISDHLGIFSDRGVTLEDIMKEKGELLKKGVLGSDGDVEFFSGEYTGGPEDEAPENHEQSDEEGEDSEDIEGSEATTGATAGRQHGGVATEVSQGVRVSERSQVADTTSEGRQAIDTTGEDSQTGDTADEGRQFSDTTGAESQDRSMITSNEVSQVEDTTDEDGQDQSAKSKDKIEGRLPREGSIPTL